MYMHKARIISRIKRLEKEIMELRASIIDIQNDIDELTKIIENLVVDIRILERDVYYK